MQNIIYIIFCCTIITVHPVSAHQSAPKLQPQASHHVNGGTGPHHRGRGVPNNWRRNVPRRDEVGSGGEGVGREGGGGGGESDGVGGGVGVEQGSAGPLQGVVGIAGVQEQGGCVRRGGGGWRGWGDTQRIRF